MPQNLRDRLGPHLMVQTPPLGTPFHSVREHVLKRLADESGRSLAAVMIDCLRQNIWPERFRAQAGSFSADDQIKLLESTAAVIGAGGLGGTVSLALARTGVGRLVICDGDIFDESNLNRQAFCDVERLGRHKARVASAEIERVNPAVRVVPFPDWATEENLPDILDGARVALDCLDNMSARYTLEKAAKTKGIPYVHAAVAGQEGLLLTVFPEDPGLAGLYGPEPAPKTDSAESLLGVPTCTPAVVGGIQAAEAINILLGRRPMARRRLVHIDLNPLQVDINELG